MSILNARNNGFIFRYPIDFIPKEISEVYEKRLRNLPTPYKRSGDFLSSTIQGVSFPSFNIETVEQSAFDKRTYKGGKDLQQSVSREFTITHKLSEGYINYWLLFEVLSDFQSHKSKQVYHKDFTVLFIDSYGSNTAYLKYIKPIITNIGGLDLSYSSTSADFVTFDVTFEFNYLELKTLFNEKIC